MYDLQSIKTAQRRDHVVQQGAVVGTQCLVLLGRQAADAEVGTAGLALSGPLEEGLSGYPSRDLSGVGRPGLSGVLPRVLSGVESRVPLPWGKWSSGGSRSLLIGRGATCISNRNSCASLLPPGPPNPAFLSEGWFP